MLLFDKKLENVRILNNSYKTYTIFQIAQKFKVFAEFIAKFRAAANVSYHC